MDPVRELPVMKRDYPTRGCDCIPGLPIPRRHAGSKKVAEARWVLPQELGDYRFPEANGPLLEAIIAGEVMPV